MLGLPVPQGYDIAQHVRFASAYQEAMVNGVVVPSWAGSENMGFGSVGVRFYPPFADYILAATQLLTRDWYDTFLINSFLWMIPGCIGVFVWVREFRTSNIAFLAASLYAVMPYHLLQIYRMQLYSEFVASAILPFCFLFATRLVRRGRILDIIGLGFSCALLVLTHLPASLIGAIALTIYVVVILDWRRPSATLTRIAAATTITIALTAFYLVRLVMEIDWVKHSGPEYSTGFFDHRRHLFPMLQTFGEGYWDYSLWRLDISIVLVLLLLLPNVIWLIKVRNMETTFTFERKAVLAVGLTGIFSVFMLSDASSLVWYLTPSLQKIQFPWRFLSVASLMASVSAACMISRISDRSWRFSRTLALTVIALLVGMILFDIAKVIPTTERPTREDFYKLSVDTRDLEGCKCWWPTWAESDAFQNQERVSAGSREVEIATWESASRDLTVGEGEPMNLRLATFFYPHWDGTVNGHPVPIGKDENGVLLVPIPAERSRVRVVFEEPIHTKISSYVSIISWLAMIVVLMFVLLSKLRKFYAPLTAGGG